MREEFCNLGTLLLRNFVIRYFVVRNFVIRNFDIRNLVPAPEGGEENIEGRFL
jgi:hypothetical protein